MKNISIYGLLSVVLLFLLPFIDSEKFIYGSINTKFFFISGFVLIYSIYYIYRKYTLKEKISIGQKCLLCISILTLFVHYLSAYFGVSLDRSLWSDIVRSTGLIYLTSLLLFAFFLSDSLKKVDWKAIRWSIIISSTIFAVITYLGPGLLNILQNEGSTFGNSTFAGVYMFIAFAVTMIEIFKDQSKEKHKRFLIASILIQFFSPLFINLGRIFTDFPSVISNPLNVLGIARASGGAVILLVIYVLGLLLIRKVERSEKALSLSWTGIVILGVLIVNAMLFIPQTIIQDKYIESSTEARIILWNGGIEGVKERPYLGWGPENFRLAHERNLDNRLYLKENFAEPWFDKAHNFYIDTLVSIGFIGLGSIILLIGFYVYVVVRARKKDLIGHMESYILGMLPFFHILQLQTGFDTPASYLIISLILGYVLWLEAKLIEPKYLSDKAGKIVSVVLLVLVLLIAYSVCTEYGRQSNLKKVFGRVSHEEQLKLIEKSFEGRVGFEALRISTTSSINGALTQAANLPPQDSAKVALLLLDQLHIYEGYYKTYLNDLPEDYRIRMNYAYLLLIKTALGEDRVIEAKEVIESSYDLSPNNPLTYVLHSLAFLYGGDIKLAKEKINEGILLNGEIEMTQKVRQYIYNQEKRFPNIAVINLENL